MAQWLGQYTGLTHATRVADSEAALRHAVGVLRACTTTEDRAKQAKIVHQLAKRLLSARTRHLKARLVATQRGATADATAKYADEINNILRRKAELVEQGLSGILAEFGVADVAGE